jgi:hypothetical protein
MEEANILHKLCNKIWNTKQWPMDWPESTFVTIHNKGKLTKCDPALRY